MPARGLKDRERGGTAREAPDDPDSDEERRSRSDGSETLEAAAADDAPAADASAV